MASYRSVYQANKTHTQLFSVWAESKGIEFDRHKTYLIPSQVREAVDVYVRLNGLGSGRKVTLDTVLADVTQSDESTLNRDDISRCVLGKMDAYCFVRLAGAERETRMRGKEPRKVTVTLKTVMGRKTVTAIANVQAYGIEEGTLAKELAQAAASSATVETSSGVTEVLVQGPASGIVVRHLRDRYALPEAFVEVLDRTKKKKK